MKHSIFNYLHGYGGGPERDPLEDFTTESLRIILERSEHFRQSFLELILGSPDTGFKFGALSHQFSIETQKRIECSSSDSTAEPDDHSKYLDMFIKVGTSLVIVGEHKARSDPEIKIVEDEEGTSVLRGKMNDYSDWLTKYAKSIGASKKFYFLAPFSAEYYLTSFDSKLPDQSEGNSGLPGNPDPITWTQIAERLRQSIEPTLNIFDKGLIEEFLFFLEMETRLAMTKIGKISDTAMELNMLQGFVMQIEEVLREISYPGKVDKGGAAKFVGAGCYFSPTEVETSQHQWWIGVYYDAPGSLRVWVDEKLWNELGEDNPNTGEWLKDPDGGRYRDFPFDKDYFGHAIDAQKAFIKSHLVAAVSEMRFIRLMRTLSGGQHRS